MNYGNVLPVTGGAGALLAGHFFGLDDIIAAAIALVLFGIAAYRYGSRIGKARTTIVIAAAAAVAGMALHGHVVGLSWAGAIAVGLSVAVVALFLVSRIHQHQAGRVAA